MADLYPPEKPVQRFSHEGLELDTRAGDGFEKHLDHSKPLPDLRRWQEEEEDHRYLNEKQMIQAHEIPQTSPTSPGTSNGVPSPQMPPSKLGSDSTGCSSPAPRSRRACGLRRGTFWLIFGIVLALVIVAAVVGGVVGGTRHSSSEPEEDSSNAAPAGANVPAQPGDVVASSPLNVISYNRGDVDDGNGGNATDQVFRIYYQSVLGNIKEAVSDGPKNWTAARPIFTDAVNNTGLATTTYKNDSESSGAQTGQIFYVGTNGYLQEKRRPFFNDESVWEPGKLNFANIKMMGNISLSERADEDPVNEFDSYSMAAVYSLDFHNGPGTRLFYHESADNGTHWVQERIWRQESDEWEIGQEIRDVSPNSHIAATMDRKNGLLRLYFSSGGLTLQEVWLNYTDPKGLYNLGLSVRNVLPQNNADLAVTSTDGSTYLYHASKTPPFGVREMIISGVPLALSLANAQQETYNHPKTPVAQPVMTSREGTSPYQPLGVDTTAVEDPGSPTRHVHVFWADHVTGHIPEEKDSLTGYRQLQVISRRLDNATWSNNNQTTVPLGSSNTFPKPESESSSRKLRRWLLSWT
ncbi:MAG: hypothetical protein Q9183_000880 [Haloplaca sp. 2 TL-2023]